MEWLNYHHLRYFWVVAKEGSLAAAASKLHVSQSSISEQVRELEASLGEKLFEKEGRKNRLTHAGKVVLSYADDIFAVGHEMVQVVRQKRESKRLRLYVGVVDSVPKLVTNEIFRPVFSMPEPVHVVFKEGKMSDLVAQLAAHRLDIILSDEPASNNVNLKLFNHTLGETGTVICAAKPLCAGLDLPFPQCLERIPALVPSDFCPLRRSLEAWFREMEISPIIAGEFDDLALMKVMAADGRGYTAIPAISVREAIQHYDFQILGEIPEVLNSYHVVTAHRKLVNPAVKMVTESAKKNLFGGSKSKPDPTRAEAA